MRAIKKIESRGVLETTHRALQNCSQVFRYAVAHGLCDRDPSGDLRGALPPVKGRHFAAIIDPPGVAKLLRSFDDFKGSYIVLGADPSYQDASTVSTAAANAEWADKDLFKAAKQIHEVTDVPLLPPQKYRHLLAMIAADVAESPFHLMETGKRVRDRCRDSGQPVSRADVNHVLRGILMRGHGFEEGPNDTDTLGRKLIDNIRSLCLREQIVLDDVTDASIRKWIFGL